MSPRRRVLVVAYYYPPVGGGGVNRTLKVSAALARAGWQPWVLTVDAAAWPQDPGLLAGVPAEARVLRLANPDWGRVVQQGGGQPQSGRGSGRLQRWLVPDLNVGWSALAALATVGFAAARAVDAVYTTCPPYSANAAGWLARRLGVPWVADFRDAWTRDVGRERLPVWRRALEQRLEAGVLKTADRVLFASEAVRRAYLPGSPGLEERSETLLTGFRPDEFPEPGSCQPDPDRLHLVHAGSAANDGKLASFDAFLDVLVAWQRREPSVARRVEIAFVGAEPDLETRLERAGLTDWVHREPAVSRSHLGQRLARAHRCLYLAPPGPAGAARVPGKLFDAAGADRRLLVLSGPGEVAALVERLDLGECADPARPDEVVARLSELCAEQRRGEIAIAPGAEGRRQLDARHAASRVVAALEAAVAARRAGPAGRLSSLGPTS